MVSDAAAALTALRSNPGLPSAGVIVLCDFGGSGTSITLVDAAAKDAPIGETVRVPDFSGDHIDQAILTKVVAGIFEASDADPSGTAMVGSLARLRDECRRAKERLSDETATAIIVDLPGLETTVRMTRMELDDLIAGPLAEFLAALVDTLERNRVPLASISAVATVGGGARIPLITQRLSEHLRAKVVTTPHPQLTAAEGVALIAHRSQIVETATTLAPAAPATVTVAAASTSGQASPAVGALAWSEVEGTIAKTLWERSPISRSLRRRAERQPTGAAASTTTSGKRQKESRRRVPVLLFGLSAAAACDRRGGVRPDDVHAGHPHRPGRHLVEHRAVARARSRGVASARGRAAPAPAPVVTTVVGRPAARVAPRNNRGSSEPAPQQPAAPRAAPPLSRHRARPNPAPEPAPQDCRAPRIQARRPIPARAHPRSTPAPAAAAPAPAHPRSIPAPVAAATGHRRNRRGHWHRYRHPASRLVRQASARAGVTPVLEPSPSHPEL